jgi:alpha-tubulin suppressor-like RCC1 family protein
MQCHPCCKMRPPRALLFTLDHLPDQIQIEICRVLLIRSRDLVSLEAVSRRFRRTDCLLPGRGGQGTTVAECAAELRVREGVEGWRLERQPWESWKFLLSLVERGSLTQLPLVAAGSDHTLVVRAAAGQLFAFGRDSHKQLGLGADDEAQFEHGCTLNASDDLEASPREVVRLQERQVVSVAAGCQHSVALTREGQLLTWGSSSLTLGPVGGFANNRGLLGHGPSPAQFHVVPAPRLVRGFPHGTRVALVAASNRHSICVTALGELYTWGAGIEALGHGDELDQHTPRKVEALAGQRLVGVDCSCCLSVAITAAGALYSWGRHSPPDFGYGPALPTQVPFPDGTRIRQVSCNGNGGCSLGAVDIEGVLYTWGTGSFNRLGHGDEEDADTPRAVAALAGKRVAMVSCGSYFAAAVTEKGNLWTWGGEVGLGTPLGHYPTHSSDPEDSDYDEGYYHGEYPERVRGCYRTPGAWYSSTPPADLVRIGRVREVRCGSRHTVVVSAGGTTFYTFGDGGHGKLGHGRMGEMGPVSTNLGRREWTDYKLNVTTPRMVVGLVKWAQAVPVSRRSLRDRSTHQ